MIKCTIFKEKPRGWKVRQPVLALKDEHGSFLKLDLLFLIFNLELIFRNQIRFILWVIWNTEMLYYNFYGHAVTADIL